MDLGLLEDNGHISGLLVPPAQIPLVQVGNVTLAETLGIWGGGEVKSSPVSVPVGRGFSYSRGSASAIATQEGIAFQGGAGRPPRMGRLVRG